MKTNNKGFSLVELIVVIAIMAILAAVAIPTFAGFITKAQVSGDVSFINDVTYAAKIANSGEHPGETVTVTVTVDGNGAVTSVQYKVGTADEVTVVETPGTAYTGIQEDIRASIDWDYTFKSTKAEGTYKIGNDGKSLAQ